MTLCSSQLFHVKSGKYVTVLPDKLATDERESLKIVLDVDGSPFSWIQVSPRYKIDREGDKILSSTELYLRIALRPNEFVHCSEKAPLMGRLREVNCSLENSSWRVSIFQSSSDSMDESLLLASQIVTITDPETKSALTIGFPEVTSLDDDEDPGEAEGENNGSNRGGGHSDDEEETKEYFHEFGDIVIRPTGSGRLDSNCLWVIESKPLTHGGPILWKTDEVRFKHLNTGQYLHHRVETRTGGRSVDDNGGGGVSGSATTCNVDVVTTTKDRLADGTLFQLFEIGSMRPQLGNAKALQCMHGGAWLERGEILDDLSYITKCTQDKPGAISLIVARYSEGAEGEGAGVVDTGKDAADDSSGIRVVEPLDVHVGV